MATLTESWGCADDSSGIDCDLTWTETVDTGGAAFQLVSNAAQAMQVDANNPSARADHDLDSADHTCSVDVTWDQFDEFVAGPTVRHDSSDVRAMFRCTFIPAVDEQRIQKSTGGSLSTIASQSKTLSPATYRVTGTAEGSTISTEIDGTVLDVTDTDLATETRCGISVAMFDLPDGSYRFTNWEAADLTSGGTVSVGRVTETDTPRTWQPQQPQTIPYNRTTTTETARPITPHKTLHLGRTAETNTARPFTPHKTAHLGRVTQTAQARPFTTDQPAAIAVGRLVETDAARPFTANRLVTVGRVTEATAARGFAVGVDQTVQVGRVVEGTRVGRFSPGGASARRYRGMAGVAVEVVRRLGRRTG